MFMIHKKFKIIPKFFLSTWTCFQSRNKFHVFIHICLASFVRSGQSHQVLTFPSSKASFSLTNAEPTASVSLEAAVTGGQISQLNTQVQNSYGAKNSDNFVILFVKRATNLPQSKKCLSALQPSQVYFDWWQLAGFNKPQRYARPQGSLTGVFI